MQLPEGTGESSGLWFARVEGVQVEGGGEVRFFQCPQYTVVKGVCEDREHKHTHTHTRTNVHTPRLTSDEIRSSETSCEEELAKNTI